MKRVYTLYRVSTKGQVYRNAKDDCDIPLQQKTCQTFASYQEGWIITKEFFERGVSGYKISAHDRDEVQNLKQAAINKEFDVLLVFMFDRLGRKEDETPGLVKWFVEHGIEVWSCKEGQRKFETHTDDLTNYITFWQAEGESKKTSIRVKERLEQLTEEGYFTGGSYAFGYKLINKGRVNKKGFPVKDIVVEEAEAEYVRQLYEKTYFEGYGSHRLATWLNNLGVRTHGGARFQSNSIIRILRNKRFLGYIINGKKESERISELQIISDFLFYEVQKILDERAKKRSEDRKVALSTKGKALLSGIAICESCGHRLTSYNYCDRRKRADGSMYELKQVRYLCYHKTRKLCECNGNSSYVAERIDKVVMEILKSIFSKIESAPQEKTLERRYQRQIDSLKKQKQNFEDDIDKHKKSLEKLQLEIANALIGESRFSPEMLADSIDTIKEKLEAAQTELKVIEGDLSNTKVSMSQIDNQFNQFVSWAQEFDFASIEHKKMIVSQLCKKVIIGRDYHVTIELSMEYKQFLELSNIKFTPKQQSVA